MEIIKAKSMDRAAVQQYVPADLIPGDWDYEALAKGPYQRALLRGSAAWSGAGLRGRAKRYSAQYHESRGNLLSRLNLDPKAQDITITTMLVLTKTLQCRRNTTSTAHRWTRRLVAIKGQEIELLA